jgi:hypothetical protein
MYMLIPLAGAYIHPIVIDFLKGFEFSTLSLDFIKIEKLFGFKDLTENFQIIESDDYLNSVGLQYKTGFMNIFSLLSTAALIIILHLCVIVPLAYYGSKLADESKKKKIINKLISYFTFTVYVRFIIEGYVLICLSSISEIYTWDTTSTYRITSVCISCAIIIFAAGFLCLKIYLWKGIDNSRKDSINPKFGEFFNGLKHTKIAQLYFGVFILRRFTSVLWVITGASLPKMIRIYIFAPIQVATCGYTLIVRPFDNFKDNLVEAVNDVYYVGFSAFLIFINEESDWSDNLANNLTFVLLMNTLIVTGIQSAFLIGTITKAILNKFKKPSATVIQDPSLVNNQSMASPNKLQTTSSVTNTTLKTNDRGDSSM